MYRVSRKHSVDVGEGMNADDHIIQKASEQHINEIVNFIDTFYRKDYFLPKSKVVRMITGKVEERFGAQRKPMYVWLSKDDKGISGVAFITRSKTLIQLLIRPDCRRCGIGSRLLEFAQPKAIRCKVDTSTGDPTGFYLKNGYLGYQKTLYGEPALVGKNNNILLLERKGEP